MTETAQAAIKAAQESAAEWVDLDRLHGWEKNPKRHPDAQVKDLMRSIQRFGWGAVILARPNGEIIAGHGRMEAAKRLGLTRVPVRWLDLDPTEAHLLALADNKLTEIGEWDDALVSEILRSAKDEGAQLDGLGWDESEIDALLKAAGEPAALIGDPDEAPEPQAQAVSRLGDLWLLASHRLLCGSSTDAASVALVMKGSLADLVITDPPYGVSYASKNAMLNSIDHGSRLERAIANDDQALKQTAEVWSKAFAGAADHMKPGASFYCFSAQGGIEMMTLMQTMISGGKIEPRHELVWLKNNHVLGRVDYAYKHEPILYAWKPGAGHKFYGGFQTSVLEFPRPQKSDLHPTMKPVALIAKLIENSSQRGEILYEPFSGSGTAIVAAEQTGRRCNAIELEPVYVDVAVRRWQSATGKQALLADDGRTFDEIARDRGVKA
jgi:DNA modification methylase